MFSNCKIKLDPQERFALKQISKNEFRIMHYCNRSKFLFPYLTMMSLTLKLFFLILTLVKSRNKLGDVEITISLSWHMEYILAEFFFCVVTYTVRCFTA